MNNNRIALDALTHALEVGESIDTDDHRDTVVELLRYVCGREGRAEVLPQAPPPRLKAYANLPRL